MQTAIVYESEGHFSASFEDSPFESFGGHTPTEALKRLWETLPGFDVDSLFADHERTRDGCMVFIIGKPSIDRNAAGFAPIRQNSDSPRPR